MTALVIPAGVTVELQGIAIVVVIDASLTLSEITGNHCIVLDRQFLHFRVLSYPVQKGIQVPLVKV